MNDEILKAKTTQNAILVVRMIRNQKFSWKKRGIFTSEEFMKNSYARSALQQLEERFLLYGLDSNPVEIILDFSNELHVGMAGAPEKVRSCFEAMIYALEEVHSYFC